MKKLIIFLCFIAPAIVFSQKVASIGASTRGVSLQSGFQNGLGFSSRLAPGIGFGHVSMVGLTADLNIIYRYNPTEKLGFYSGVGFNSVQMLSFGETNETYFNSHIQMPIGLEFFPFKNPNRSISIEGIFSPVRTGFFYFDKFGFTPNIQLNFYLKPKEIR